MIHELMSIGALSPKVKGNGYPVSEVRKSKACPSGCRPNEGFLPIVKVARKLW